MSKVDAAMERLETIKRAHAARQQAAVDQRSAGCTLQGTRGPRPEESTVPVRPEPEPRRGGTIVRPRLPRAQELERALVPSPLELALQTQGSTVGRAAQEVVAEGSERKAASPAGAKARLSPVDEVVGAGGTLQGTHKSMVPSRKEQVPRRGTIVRPRLLRAQELERAFASSTQEPALQTQGRTEGLAALEGDAEEPERKVARPAGTKVVAEGLARKAESSRMEVSLAPVDEGARMEWLPTSTYVAFCAEEAEWARKELAAWFRRDTQAWNGHAEHNGPRRTSGQTRPHDCPGIPQAEPATKAEGVREATTEPTAGEPTGLCSE